MTHKVEHFWLNRELDPADARKLARALEVRATEAEEREKEDRKVAAGDLFRASSGDIFIAIKSTSGVFDEGGIVLWNLSSRGSTYAKREYWERQYNITFERIKTASQNVLTAFGEVYR